MFWLEYVLSHQKATSFSALVARCTTQKDIVLFLDLDLLMTGSPSGKILWMCHPEYEHDHSHNWSDLMKNMTSFIHVSCLHSESLLNLQFLSFMILVSHVAADCEETTSVSGEPTDSLVDLVARSLLLPSGDLYYLVSINVR